VVFKLLEKFNVNTLQSIVVNYLVAFSCGMLINQKPVAIQSIFEAQWFLGSIVLGVMFIGIFNIMAWTAQKNGLSVASVASKMSVIIPVIFGIYLYEESIGFQKIIGIVLALISVYLVSAKSKTSVNFKKNLLLPVVLFFGSGIIDTSIKYLQNNYVPEDTISLFSASIFLIAAVVGIGILTVQFFRKEFQFDPKSILGGIALGIVNYASLFFIIKALNLPNTESSTLFTINNVAIVMVSTLIGLLIFKEQLSKKNWAGIGLALISIYLVTFA
jgi:drug/metabolite transporter (DMT)-like permease